MQEEPQDERAEMREEGDGGRGDGGGGGGRGTEQEPVMDTKTIIVGYIMAFIIVGNGLNFLSNFSVQYVISNSRTVFSLKVSSHSAS